MLIEILRRTPPWVFVLFFVLLAFGWHQSKTRSVRRSTVTILPAVMLILSLSGVLSAFGSSPVAVVSWLTGTVIAMIPCLKSPPRAISYQPETRSFTVPGSWLPLAIMMAIFFTRYAMGVILARRLPIVAVPAFIACICLVYGLLSGVFLARAMTIMRAAKSGS